MKEPRKIMIGKKQVLFYPGSNHMKTVFCAYCAKPCRTDKL